MECKMVWGRGLPMWPLLAIYREGPLSHGAAKWELVTMRTPVGVTGEW